MSDRKTRPPRSVTSFTHLDEEGRSRMVDVGAKAATARSATARGRVYASAETLRAIESNAVAKGNVFEVARVAGILAAKRTGDLIPLCHPLALDVVAVQFRLNAAAGCIDIEATASLTGKTGVEMEAMTAVSVAALTIYDMCKALDKGMTISDVRLVRKSGGKSGAYERPGE
ncbi:MAG: cyclic pyranopterin monophosphate synthase MoaC [Candidatus Tectomicrobia bacterium]|nr:cyclic pyranopterin monophosphate synthase MoaC [Candidatus Tectomicrobia bacterium]